MDKQREEFEKFKAKQMNISYEKLKYQLDYFERKTNDRYGVVGFDNDWSIWQQAQKVVVPAVFVVVPIEPPEGMDLKICNMVDHRIDCFEADRIYKAMIEAGEKK